MDFDLRKLQEPCDCGKTHALEVKEILIEENALRGLSALLREGALSTYHHPVIICDENTLAAAGAQIEDVLRTVPAVILSPDHLHADNAGVARAEAALVEKEGYAPADLLLAVGSGTIHDITRYIAHQKEIPFVSCPTAASVDGFVSTVAAMTWDGMKATLPAVAPVMVIADTRVIAAAPWRLTASGMSDLFGKYSALCDWRIAHAVTGEYLCERICEMEREAMREVRECMDALREGEPAAYAKLTYALLLSGLAMQMVGNSRPASCAEHHLSHFWEMEVLNDTLDALHGEKVGVGLRLVAREYHRMARVFREGSFRAIPWRGIEREKIEESFGRKGLLQGVLKENMPDPMTKILPEDVTNHIPEIIEIIEEELPTEEDIVALLTRGGCPKEMKDIGLTDDLIAPSLALSPYVRNRLSFMRLKKMIVTEA